jgi:diguanylate cyclase (GGDEF)-like protein
MMQNPKKPDHWIVRMNHRNRTWCFLLVFAALVTHMADKGYGPLAWSLLALQFLVYPQLVYWRARRAHDPKRAELNNLAVDGLCFGAWMAALGFPLWITFILFMSVTVNLTAFNSRKGFAQALTALSCGVLLGVAITGWRLTPTTEWPVTLLSIVCVSIFMLLIAEGAYSRSIKLHEAREQLRLSEQALKQQLHEIHALQAQLNEQVNRDPLTGLYNRRFFGTTLERELARCERENQPLSLVLIDIDHFKKVNDSYGHPAGDEVLKCLAAMLNDQARASDVACRYGGEEFLMLLPNMPRESALKRAEQWRSNFEAMTIAFKEARMQTTLSVGIAVYPEHGKTPEELIRCADIALYLAKTAGRNRVVVFGAETTVVSV